MKTLLIGAIAASTLALALPAAAQVYASPRAAQLEDAIDAGLDNGALDSSDARDLRAQLRSVERMDRLYQDDGMTFSESRDLDRRYDALSDQVDALSAR